MNDIRTISLENNKSDIKKFVLSAWNFHRGNAYWVPPLIVDLVKFILTGPYHEVGTLQPFLAYRGGDIAGFIISIPDANAALQKANGRLFPFGLFRILLAMRKIDRLKTIVMGVRPKYRMRGLDAYFYVETFERAKKLGYTVADMSLIVENNHSMRNALEHMGAKIYKTYRFFHKEVALTP